MHASADRLDFAPPPPPGMLRAFVLALIAHLLLLLALTWGVNWNRESDSLTAEAELWSAAPQQAAPRAVEPVPTSTPPAPVTPPPPPPPAVKIEAPAPVPPAPRQADIALEREKKKREEAKERQEELEREKKIEARKKLAAQKKVEAEKQEKRERQEMLDKQALAKKSAEDKKKAEAAQAAQAARVREEARRQEARHQENVRRMQGLAGATGAPTSSGTAARSSGPSDSYAGRIRARVKPNIVFSDDIPGNPTAEVEVRMAPDGTIVSKRVVKSSGFKSWDDAVLRALDKTEVLPRDVDGRVHTPLLIEFRPRS